MEKHCKGCGETKPESEFYRYPSGHAHGKCRACYSLRYRLAHPFAKPRGRRPQWTASKLIGELEQIKTALGHRPTEPEISQLSKRRLAPSIKTFRNCFGSWSNALRSAGFELTQRRPDSPAIERKRLRDRLGYIRPSLRFQVLIRDKFSCAYCGSNPKSGAVLQVDHVVPVSAGGETALHNLVTACWVCNIGKSDSLLEVEAMANAPRSGSRLRHQESPAVPVRVPSAAAAGGTSLAVARAGRRPVDSAPSGATPHKAEGAYER